MRHVLSPVYHEMNSDIIVFKCNFVRIVQGMVVVSNDIEKHRLMKSGEQIDGPRFHLSVFQNVVIETDGELHQYDFTTKQSIILDAETRCIMYDGNVELVQWSAAGTPKTKVKRHPNLEIVSNTDRQFGYAPIIPYGGTWMQRELVNLPAGYIKSFILSYRIRRSGAMTQDSIAADDVELSNAEGLTLRVIKIDGTFYDWWINLRPIGDIHNRILKFETPYLITKITLAMNARRFAFDAYSTEWSCEFFKYNQAPTRYRLK